MGPNDSMRVSPAPPDPPYTKRYAYDGANNLEYEGWVKTSANAATSDAAWAIKRYSYDGANKLTAEQFADGNNAEDNVWDNRAALSYS